MKLCLSDGTVFSGRAFGAQVQTRGEVVFHTGLTGYVEALTDPSYRGQILVLTYPLIGNYGVPEEGHESGAVQVSGLVVAKHTAHRGNLGQHQTVGEWLLAQGVPAIEGVDTRRLVTQLRSFGTMPGALLYDETEGFAQAKGVPMEEVLRCVALSEEIRLVGAQDMPTILVIDAGAKESLIRALHTRGANLVRISAEAEWETVLPDIDGVVVSSGPGNPQHFDALAHRLRRVLAMGIPTFGICLGHQLVCRALGATTYKLPFGHRSHNQPVVEKQTGQPTLHTTRHTPGQTPGHTPGQTTGQTTGRAFVTSQNHGYAVEQDTLPKDLIPWFENVNDGTNEGVRHAHLPIFSVQFHPEGGGGPHDTAWLFDEWLTLVASKKGSRS
jgi:carbamoyl-phosphate synthase small subunit